jgi:ATP-binding cassette subfamily B protein
MRGDSQELADVGTCQILDRTASGFIWRQLRAFRLRFLVFFSLVITAAAAAVAVQYGMKLLVGAMTEKDVEGVYTALWLFLGLIAVESALWRSVES